jgi:hypothetical protein
MRLPTEGRPAIAHWKAPLVLCVMIFCLLAGLAPLGFAQTPLTLAGPTLSALKEAKGSLETLINLKIAATDALAGKTPSIGGDWSKLADSYDKASADAKAAPVPSALTSSNNVVSLAELMNCSTRQSAITKLYGYQTDLRNTQVRGQDGVKQLDGQLADIVTARAALTYLISVHQQLAAVPVYGDKFALDWLDLNTRVSRSLSDLESALKNQRKRFSDDLVVLNTRIQNYQSNLALTHCLPSCNPAAPEGSLIKSPQQPEVYFIQCGQRHHIPDPKTLQAKWSWSQVRTVPQTVVNSMPLGTPVPKVP